MSSPGDQRTIADLERIIEEFHEAARDFRKGIGPTRTQSEKQESVDSRLSEIGSAIGRIKEHYIPLSLVSGVTCANLYELLQGIQKLLVKPGFPDEDDVDYNKFNNGCRALLNHLQLIELENTPQRRAMCLNNRLLCLDGGGVRGICSLVALQAIMKAIQAIENGTELEFENGWVENDEKLPHPMDYIDLVGGTSTGGLIAIMLFRLGMPISEVKKEYNTLSKEIFKPGISRFIGSTFWKPLFNMPWFHGSKLENSIRDVVQKKEGEGGDDIRLMGRTPGSKAKAKSQMFVCAVTKRAKHAINFRNYKPHDLRIAKNYNCTIVEAARATSAAPFFFPAMKIGKTTFWDGGLQNNNPVCQVLAENGPEIAAVVVSLGTGRTADDKELEVQMTAEGDDVDCEVGDIDQSWFKLRWPVLSQIKAVLNFVTNAESEHRSFARVLNHHKVPYFRLNPVIQKDVSLSDFEKMDYLRDNTINYCEGKPEENDHGEDKSEREAKDKKGKAEDKGENADENAEENTHITPKDIGNAKSDDKDIPAQLMQIAQLLLRPKPLDPLKKDDGTYPDTPDTTDPSQAGPSEPQESLATGTGII